jgi:hypothetical protein
VAPSTSAVITEIEHDLKTGAIEHESVFTWIQNTLLSVGEQVVYVQFFAYFFSIFFVAHA